MRRIVSSLLNFKFAFMCFLFKFVFFFGLRTRSLFGKIYIFTQNTIYAAIELFKGLSIVF